ncbi:MAG: peptidase [Caulobacterales bacterium]
MTYCVGLLLMDGLVLLSDTRTNAGPDNIASYTKMHVCESRDRVITLMSAGNLAITQAVVARVMEGAGAPEDFDAPETLYTVTSMFDAARLVGDAIREVYIRDGQSLAAQSYAFDASVILAGQIKDRRMRMFNIYSAGNFIEAGPDTPYFQIGETKYGKPILDRVAKYDTPLNDAVKLALISMDSTLRSNFSVGLPADLMVVKRDPPLIATRQRITADDEYFRTISDSWSAALRQAYRDLPAPPWINGGANGIAAE